MPDISKWSETAASNDSADPNINWLENQLPSTVNNSARAMMAAIKGFADGDTANGLEWFNYGHVPTRTGNTTFTIPTTDWTTYYVARRRVKLTDATTLYATVVSSSFGAALTTVTVSVDGGTALSASLSAVFLSPQMPSNLSAPVNLNKDAGGTTGGILTAYTLTLTPPMVALVTGAEVSLKFHVANGAGATLAVNGTAATPLTKTGGTALAANDYGVNSSGKFRYDGTNWEAVSGPLQSAAGGAYTIKTAGFTAAGGNRYVADCSNTAFTVTMPATPATTDAPIVIKKEGNNLLTIDFGTNQFRLDTGVVVTGTVTFPGYIFGDLSFAYIATNAGGTTTLWVV